MDVFPDQNVKILLGPSNATLTNHIPNGPYFVDLQKGDIFEGQRKYLWPVLISENDVHLFAAWRLYDDTNGACLYGIIPDGKGAYKQLPAHANTGDATQSVAVPSRLYFTPSAKQPLAAKRIAVIDII